MTFDQFYYCLLLHTFSFIPYSYGVGLGSDNFMSSGLMLTNLYLTRIQPITAEHHHPVYRAEHCYQVVHNIHRPREHYENVLPMPEKNKKQLNHNSTQPQPNITLVGLDMKMPLHTTPPTPPHTNSMSAISQLLVIQF